MAYTWSGNDPRLDQRWFSGAFSDLTGFEPRLEQRSRGFCLANYSFPELGSIRVIHGTLAILVRELEGNAAGIDKLLVQNVLIDSHSGVLCAAARGAAHFCEAAGYRL